MSDERLRELERRFRVSGSVENEAAWLRARMQAGELEQSKLELAAHLGYQAAICVLEIEGCHSLRRFVEEVVSLYGANARRRSALAVTYRALSAFSHRNIEDDLRLLDDIGAMVYDFSEGSSVPDIAQTEDRRRRRGAWDTIDSLLDLLRGHQIHWDYPGIDYEGQGEGGAESWIPARIAIAPEKLAARAVFLGEELVEVSWASAEARCEGQVLNAIRADLVPWALGYSDPVRERVEARQRGTAGE